MIEGKRAVSTTILGTILTLLGSLMLSHVAYEKHLIKESQYWSGQIGSIIETWPDPVWVKELNGKVRFLNKAFVEQFEVGRPEALGVLDEKFPLQQLYEPEDKYLMYKDLGEKGKWFVQVFPIFDENQEVVAIGGRCWPKPEDL